MTHTKIRDYVTFFTDIRDYVSDSVSFFIDVKGNVKDCLFFIFFFQGYLGILSLFSQTLKATSEILPTFFRHQRTCPRFCCCFFPPQTSKAISGILSPFFTDTKGHVGDSVTFFTDTKDNVRDSVTFFTDTKGHVRDSVIFHRH